MAKCSDLEWQKVFCKENGKMLAPLNPLLAAGKNNVMSIKFLLIFVDFFFYCDKSEGLVNCFYLEFWCL